MELTFSRSLKVWWSYTWRFATLSLPISLLLAVSLSFMLSVFTNSQDSSSAPTLSIGAVIFGYLAFVGVSILIHTYTLRSALKVKWSDFKMVVVPIGSNEIQFPKSGSQYFDA